MKENGVSTFSSGATGSGGMGLDSQRIEPHSKASQGGNSNIILGTGKVLRRLKRSTRRACQDAVRIVTALVRCHKALESLLCKLSPAGGSQPIALQDNRVTLVPEKCA